MEITLFPARFNSRAVGYAMAVPTLPLTTTVVPNFSISDGLPERTNDVEDGVARLQHAEQHGGLADGLHDDGDGPGLGIGVRYGERDAFAGVVQTDDDELARALFFRDTRRLDFEQFDASRQRASCDNREHRIPPPLILLSCDPTVCGIRHSRPVIAHKGQQPARNNARSTAYLRYRSRVASGRQLNGV